MHRRRCPVLPFVFGLALVAALGAGCLASGEEPAGSAAGDTFASDTMDQAGGPDAPVGTAVDVSVTTPDGGTSGCRVTHEPGAFAPPVGPWHVAVASREAVMFGGDGRWGTDDAAVYRYAPESPEASVVTPAAARVVLLDARDGAWLELVVDPAEGTQRVEHHTDTSVSVVMPESASEVVIEGGVGERPARLVRHDRAAWRGFDDPNHGAITGMWLRGWEAGEGVTRTLWETDDPQHPGVRAPFVDEAGVVWAEPRVWAGPIAWDGTTENAWAIRTWSSGEAETVRVVETDEIRSVARYSDGGLLWTSPLGAWFARGDDAPQQLAAGPCQGLDSDGVDAAFVCWEPILGRTWPHPTLPGAQGQLWLHHRDGGPARRITAGAGAFQALPQVEGGLVAWLSYPEPTDGCTTFGPGQVWVASTAQPEGGVMVGTLGIGGYCANSVWPLLGLSLHDGLVAWNYALVELPASVGDRRGGGLGWARVALRCD